MEWTKIRFFSPVPHQQAVKAAFAEIASLDLEFKQFDIKTVFYANMNQPNYMQQQGFVVQGKEDHVSLLVKSLYGLKKAPNLWQYRLDEVLTRFGLKNCDVDETTIVICQ